MKKIVLLTICILACNMQMFSQKIVETNYFENHLDLGGDVVIKNSTQEVVGNKAITSFDVESPKAGDYYVSFWMLPTKLAGGNFASYAISVNGHKLTDKIIPTVGDWQTLTLSKGKAISLNKGINRISVEGVVPDVPNVEHIRLSTNLGKARISNIAYKKYKSEVEQESIRDAMKNSMILNSLNTDTLENMSLKAVAKAEAALYNFTYVSYVELHYTFYKTVSFNEGQKIFVSTNGINNFSHVLELFSATTPENYSWSSMSNGNTLASLNVTIPKTGLYYVRVRSYLNGKKGMCNVNINGENYYENVPIYSIGLRCTQGNDKIYNTFTCHNVGDPRIWIEEGSTTPGRITAFNDDYRGSGDFAWGSNSRINKKFPRTVDGVLLSTYSSYNPDGKCELYVKCQKSTVYSSFTKLKEDDAIQSAPASTQYNCISWSGGITSYWEWPLSTFSSYYSSNPLTAFDNFYASRGLTRTGATENSSVVDLWAYIGANGSRNYSHASIRNGADNNAHGYDWESKPGQLMRTFHPRYALEGTEADGYGKVVEYYVKTNKAAKIATVEEEIANGVSEIEYTDFDQNELNVISRRINAIDGTVLLKFNALYDKWKSVVENSIFSNPVQIADCKEYKELLTLCIKYKELKYAVFAKLDDKDIAAIQLVEDLTIKENNSVLQEMKDYNAQHKTRAGVKILRPVITNTISYVKRLLALDGIEKLQKSRNRVQTTGISYSNSQEFSAVPSSEGTNVTFALDSPSVVSLSLLDLTGKNICIALNEATIESGTHSYSLPASLNGVYLVRLTIDGRVNVKKITIKK